MGGRSSREASWKQDSSFRAASSSCGHQHGYSQSPYVQESQVYQPQQAYPSQQYYTPSEEYNSNTRTSQQYYPPSDEYKSNTRRLDRRYSRIADDYKSLDQVTAALARAGLESSNLIIGIDFTKSNEWTGLKSFNRRSLHHVGDGLNPYEQAISIIGKTLAAFDEDNLIPGYGFGDASTHDQDVFSFYPDERLCNGFEGVLNCYREIVPHLKLAGPTSFAPIIEMAMTVVEQSRGQYHVLLIIADGQVTRSVDTEPGCLSPQEQKTVNAIVEASKLPLSIVLVGVGDGPWDMMKEFDDNIPARAFDNFQFVNFTEIMAKNYEQFRKETEFALTALMEIPSQYKATIELGILGHRNGNVPERAPLPPPVYGGSASFSHSNPSYSTSFKPNAPFYQEASGPVSSAPPATSSTYENEAYGVSASFSHSNPSYSTSFKPNAPFYQEASGPVSSASPATSSTYENEFCPICLTNAKDMAFGCGHQTCCECGQDLQSCPLCGNPIHTRIKLY